VGAWNLSLVRAEQADRLRYSLALLGLLAWLLYTRVFWTLHSFHATFPSCPFRLLTGQPCPLCGGTRSFAQMWQGDVVGAARYHPLGPALFVLTLAGAAALAALVLRGQVLRWRPTRRAEHRLYWAVGAVFLMAWLYRLAFLPLPL
jgi:hypothetical protein